MVNTNQNKLQDEIVQKSLDFFKYNDKGWIDGAMRLGKMKITINILKNLFDFHNSVLIAYPDNKLLDGWKSEFNKWNYENPNIVYVNFSSLHKYKDTQFLFFCIDEFHSCSERERIMAQMIAKNCKYTLCLSGTISKETKQKWPSFKEIYKYTTLEGIKDQILADYQITVHLVDLDNTIKTPNKKGKMKSEADRYRDYTYVMKQFKENGKDYMHLALARNRLSLNSIAKVQYTKELLHNNMQDKRVVIFSGLSEVADQFPNSYHSKSPDNSNYTMFLNKDINWLSLASMGKVGVSYPSLDSVILLNFTYNASETSQILNRAIQLDYNCKVADLHVICLNEPPELKKIKESLSMLDKNRIKYV